MRASEMSKRIVIAGGTGFIGRALTNSLIAAGYQVSILTRNPAENRNLCGSAVNLVSWDAMGTAEVDNVLRGAFALINLAGQSIAGGRWTNRRKKSLVESRVNTGKALAKALKKGKNKPEVFIQASGIGYYGDKGEQEITEAAPVGGGFLCDLCQEWEGITKLIEAQSIRCLIVRIAPVLGASGGMLAKVIPSFRYFAGGCPGSGRQWFSWIHIDDLVGGLRFLLENQNLQGIYNLAAPEPLRAGDFYRLLGRELHRPCYFPLPGFLLKLVLGEMAEEMLLVSQRVVPQKLLQGGFKFSYPRAEMAMENILTKND